MVDTEERQMGMSLSIKNVPDDWVERLRDRADRHHRSLQGELMSILEATLQSEGRLTVEELLQEIRGSGWSPASEGVGWWRPLSCPSRWRAFA
jgi:plasmid stability protein